MANSVNSIDTIKNKILAEAREYENNITAEAKKEAGEITTGFEKKAKEAQERILTTAKLNADGIVSSAQSSQSMRARNNLLAVKVELIEKTYDLACEKIGKLPKEEYLSLFSAYLKKAFANAKLYEGKIILTVGKASPVSCSELKEAAGIGGAEIEEGGKSEKSDLGFFLTVGDITLDCSAHTLVAGIRNETETGVAKILFSEA